MSIVPPSTQSSEYDQKLVDQIVAHEGLNRFCYNDTLGYKTIGVGRCIDERVGSGLSIDEIFYLLRNDLKTYEYQLQPFVWFKVLDKVRQGVLIELNFNMGLNHLLCFKDMIKAIEKNDWNEACNALADSRWAKQVKEHRLNDLQFRLLTGTYK